MKIESPCYTLSRKNKSSEFEQSLSLNGFAVVRQFLNKETTDSIVKSLQPLFAKRAPSEGLFWGRKTTRIEALLNQVEVQNIVLDPLLLELAGQILSGNCDQIQLNLTQGIRIHPGEQAQVIHRDSSMYPTEKPFDFMVNAIIALSPFLPETGATRVVRGSHRWDELRRPLPEEIESVNMAPGDMLFYNSSLLHGGGANTSQQERTGLAISYSLGWLRQSENMYLTYPPKVAKNFPKQLSKLIGYEVHRPNLGWAFGQNPMCLLDYGIQSSDGAAEFLTPEQQSKLNSLN